MYVEEQFNQVFEKDSFRHKSLPIEIKSSRFIPSKWKKKKKMALH